MSKLSKRLEKIYNLVGGNIVADVGCDHGKLSHKLLSTDRCNFVYVSDISKPSLEKAEKLLSKYNCFEAIHCDGLRGYVDKTVDECIISGMGGEEIIQIIDSSPIDIPSYILSPQKNETKVKEYMISLGFGLTYDEIVEDKGKYYHIFKCEKGKQSNIVDELDLIFGRDSFSETNTDLIDFIEYEINKTRNIYDRVDEKKKEELDKYLATLELAKKRKGN